MRILVLLLVSALSIGSSAGCDNRPAATATAAPARQPVSVVATTYAMAAVVKAIGGQHVRVEWWVESGQSLAELAETPERRKQLNTVELIVTRGQQDPWTLAASGSAFQSHRILRLDLLPAARGIDAAHYAWLDPLLARQLAEELASRLAVLRPEHQAAFRANAKRFLDELDQLMANARQAADRAGGGPFLTLDERLYPLAQRFGLELVRLRRVDLRVPSAFNVRQLRQTAADEGAGAIFASTETPTALVREWESRLELPVLTIDPLGTSAQAGRSTYLEMLRYNLAQLEKGVSLAKPRERRVTPRALGAVVEQPPAAPPIEPATVPATQENAATMPPVAPVAPVAPVPQFSPPPASPRIERVPLNLPLPTTQNAPARPLPFGPAPAPAPTPAK